MAKKCVARQFLVLFSKKKYMQSLQGCMKFATHQVFLLDDPCETNFQENTL